VLPLPGVGEAIPVAVCFGGLAVQYWPGVIRDGELLAARALAHASDACVNGIPRGFDGADAFQDARVGGPGGQVVRGRIERQRRIAQDERAARADRQQFRLKTNGQRRVELIAVEGTWPL